MCKAMGSIPILHKKLMSKTKETDANAIKYLHYETIMVSGFLLLLLLMSGHGTAYFCGPLTSEISIYYDSVA
jgi:hypothetical protein